MPCSAATELRVNSFRLKCSVSFCPSMFRLLGVLHVHVLTAYIITPRPSALAMPEMRVRMVFTITVQMFFFSVVIFVKFKRMVSKIKSLIITLFIG